MSLFLTALLLLFEILFALITVLSRLCCGSLNNISNLWAIVLNSNLLAAHSSSE